MLKSFVVRFSDYQHDTIREHKKIIEDQQVVYWGWWKKRVEKDHYHSLVEFQKNCPLKIGLLNRAEKKCYLAICEDIILGDDGETIKTPDSNLTPEYYTEYSLFAWFVLSEIDSISEEEFQNEFHNIPDGEPTLFIVSENEIIDSKFNDDNLKKTKGNSILHLSDLHFGADHNYKDTVKRYHHHMSLFEKIKPILNNYKNEIGIIIASGDFVTKANENSEENSFDDAIIFLNDLSNFFSLDKKNFIVVPGNHDMPFEDEKNPKIDSHYQTQYIKFRKEFLDIDETEDLQFFERFQTPNNWTLTFSCFNSSRIKDKEFSNYGFIGKDQFDPVLEKLKIINSSVDQDYLIKEKNINFAVIHHHLKFYTTPQHPRPRDNSVSVLLDAGLFENDLINSGMHFLLHGHQHLPHVGSSAIFKKNDKKRVNLNIIGAGSAGSIIAKGYPDRFPYNSFNIYTPKEDFLEVKIEKFTRTSHDGHDEYYVPYF